MVFRKHTSKSVFVWWIIALAVLAVSISICIVFVMPKNQGFEKQGIVLVGDPVRILSWNRKTDAFVVVTIPSDVWVGAIHGYGSYRIDALYKLDVLEKRKGELFVGSLVDALALPITDYLDITRFDIPKDADAREVLRRAFTPRTVVYALLHKFQTSLSLGTVLQLFLSVQNIGPTGLTEYDIRKSNLSSQDILADQTTAQKLDTNRFDILLGSTFQEDKIRSERIRVGVVNTTAMPGLAQNISRLLDRIGAWVVFVDSSDTKIAPVCIIRGEKDKKTSAIVGRLEALFGCSFEETDEETQADIIVFLGEQWAKRYLPYGK